MRLHKRRDFWTRYKSYLRAQIRLQERGRRDAVILGGDALRHIVEERHNDDVGRLLVAVRAGRGLQTCGMLEKNGPTPCCGVGLTGLCRPGECWEKIRLLVAVQCGKRFADLGHVGKKSDSLLRYSVGNWVADLEEKCSVLCGMERKLECPASPFEWQPGAEELL